MIGRNLLTAAACAVCAIGLASLAASPAMAQDVRILAEHDEPAGSLVDRLLNEMASELSDASNGRIELVVNAGASLSGGNIRTMIQNTQSGAVHMGMIATSIYTSFDSRLNVFSLPFLVADIDQLEAVARKSEVAKELFAAQEDKGLHVVDSWTRALRQIVNARRPIESVGDIEGLRFRVPEIPLWADAFRAVGAQPIAMPFSEIPVAMQTNAVDGGERPTAFLESEKWWTMADYVTMANYTGDVVMVAFNLDFWNGLTSEDQELITATVKRYGDRNHVGEKDGEAEILAKLKSEGMTVTILTPEAHGQFKSAMESVWTKYQGDIGEDIVQRAAAAVQ